MSTVYFSTWAEKLQDFRQQPASRPEAKSCHLPAQFGRDDNLRAIFGWDGLVIYDPDVDLVAMATSYLEGVQAGSCGQCVPCPVGTKVMLDIFRKIGAGQGSLQDLERLQFLSGQVRAGSMCDFGQKAPVPILDLLKHFGDYLRDYIQHGRKALKDFAAQHDMIAPCTATCPAHTDIPGYIEHIKYGRFQESLELIRETDCMPGSLGRACYAPCESTCRRTNVDETINIRLLKRFVYDQEIQYSRERDYQHFQTKTTLGPVAIIGAGFAGLACADNLAQKGIAATIYEMYDRPGGMATWGIPDYRLPPSVIDDEVEKVKRAGVEILYNQKLGRDFLLKDLWEQGFKAVCLAFGAHDSKIIGIPGEQDGYQGYYRAVEYLAHINRDHGFDAVKLGKKAIVIGAGNVAMDCIRSARRAGAEVFMVYRRGLEQMPAHMHEYHDAHDEGVQFIWWAHPQSILTENNRVVGLRLVKMQEVPGKDGGRATVEAIPGSEFTVECDSVISAIGQAMDFSWKQSDDDIKLTRWDTVEVDAFTRQSVSDARIFAAGDVQTGTINLIEAIGNGNRAAFYIEQFLQHGEVREIYPYDRFERLVRELGSYDPEEQVNMPANSKRQQQAFETPAERLKDFREIEHGYTPAQAIAEASRCMRCYNAITVATQPSAAVQDGLVLELGKPVRVKHLSEFEDVA